MLSGAGHAPAAAVVAETAALPPTLEKSYLLKDGDTITGLVLVFSKPLDPATAQDPNNYQVTRSIAGIPDETVTAATYDASQQSVTLSLSQPFTLPQPLSPGLNNAFTVTVPRKDSGMNDLSAITDTSGQHLIAGFMGYANGLICNVPVQGEAPSQLVVPFSQARLNTVVAKLAAAQGIRITTAVHPIHLTGTIQGTYSPVSSSMNAGLFSISTVDMMTKGSGSLSPVGRVTDVFDASPFVDPKSQGESPPEQWRTFHNKRGTFEVEINNLQWVTSNSVTGDYTVTGGTKAYSGQVGSGHIQVTWAGNRSHGKVTEIYN